MLGKLCLSVIQCVIDGSLRQIVALPKSLISLCNGLCHSQTLLLCTYLVCTYAYTMYMQELSVTWCRGADDSMLNTSQTVSRSLPCHASCLNKWDIQTQHFCQCQSCISAEEYADKDREAMLWTVCVPQLMHCYPTHLLHSIWNQDPKVHVICVCVLTADQWCWHG